MTKKLSLTMVDDDRNFLQILALAFDDFRVSTFSNPTEALTSIKISPPDAVILDLHMQDTDGFEVCREIRKFNLNVPIIFLTSDSTFSSMKEGLDLGCVDYLSKSSPIDEIRLRISHRVKNLKQTFSPNKILEFGILRMDIDAHRVTSMGLPVSLSKKEFEILKVFLESPNKVFSKTELMEILWKDVTVDANNIDTHMFHIRKKLTGSTQIQTIKGLGYILRAGA